MIHVLSKLEEHTTMSDLPKERRSICKSKYLYQYEEDNQNSWEHEEGEAVVAEKVETTWLSIL